MNAYGQALCFEGIMEQTGIRKSSQDFRVALVRAGIVETGERAEIKLPAPTRRHRRRTSSGDLHLEKGPASSGTAAETAVEGGQAAETQTL